MKKTLLYVCLIFCFYIGNAQSNVDKAWELLAENKRDEAYSVVKNELKKNQNPSIELWFTQHFIEKNLGTYFLDVEQLKTFSTYNKEAYYYSFPLLTNDFLFTSFDHYYYDGLKEKLESLSQSEVNRNLFYTFKYIDMLRYTKQKESFKTLDANLNMIKEWQFCGPFENPNGNGIFVQYQPEMEAKENAVYDANANGKLSWYTKKNTNHSSFISFENELKNSKGIMYLQTFIQSDSEQVVQLRFNTYSDCKVFLNDVEIYFEDELTSSKLGSNIVEFKLRKGSNRLLIKTEVTNAVLYAYEITDSQGNAIQSLRYSKAFAEYSQDTMERIQPKKISPDFEVYFENKAKENPNSIMYQYLLAYTYLYTGNVQNAVEIAEKMYTKNHKSTLYKKVYIDALSYDKNDRSQEIKSIIENMEQDDTYSYLAITQKVLDIGKLIELPVEKFNSYHEKAKKLRDQNIAVNFDFAKLIKEQDKEGLLQIFPVMLKEYNNSHKLLANIMDMEKNITKDVTKTKNILLELNSKYSNFNFINKLSAIHEDAGELPEQLKLMKDFSAENSYSNYALENYATLLIRDKKYDEALIQLQKAKENYPFYTEVNAKFGDVYTQLKQKDMAMEFYQKALSYDPSSSSVRNKINLIRNKKDNIEEVATPDLNEYIKKNRNKSTLKSDTGAIVLLDEYIAEVFPEGGFRTKVVLLFEITDEMGIENYKENEVNNYQDLKAEIVKADTSGGSIVFENLQLKDVIKIEYYTESFDTGVFYKDAVLSYYFDGAAPSVYSRFGILSPKGYTYKVHFPSKSIASQTKKVGDLNYEFWETHNTPSNSLNEQYSPVGADYLQMISVSSIKNWGKVEKWYADLVQNILKKDAETQKAFDEIFPNGFSQFSQYERAQKIYDYIAANINYSSVDFRQSNYVPQKPATTLRAKLGDCKDLSSLFLVLGEMANIQSNLVLVLTADNGQKYFELPNKGFNHCIVKTTLDGKEYFLELTNKYAAFNSFSPSLYKAKALVIRSNSNSYDDSKLIEIPTENNLPNQITVNYTLQIKDKNTTVHMNVLQNGDYSYYNSVFKDPSQENIKNVFLDLIKDLDGKNAELSSYTFNRMDSKNATFDFDVNFSIKDKLQKVSSFYIFSLPFLFTPHVSKIIAEEKRVNDIKYIFYETISKYNLNYKLVLEKELSFTDLPKNQQFQFKNHTYSISYELVSPQEANVKVEFNCDYNDILPADYTAFKTFVEQILEAQKEVLAFK